MESYGQTNYIFLFSSWAFVSLQELNLCINYTSELNEGAGVPVTALAFYQKTLHTHLASSESSYESFLLGSWGPRGAELGTGGWRRWRSCRPGFLHLWACGQTFKPPE